MNPSSTGPTTLSERIALAQRLFRENYAACFWHLRPDLEITEATIPLIVKGLRLHGGRRDFVEAARLEQGGV